MKHLWTLYKKEMKRLGGIWIMLAALTFIAGIAWHMSRAFSDISRMNVFEINDLRYLFRPFSYFLRSIDFLAPVLLFYIIYSDKATKSNLSIHSLPVARHADMTAKVMAVITIGLSLKLIESILFFSSIDVYCLQLVALMNNIELT